MTRDEALGILRTAHWSYTRRLNSKYPFPAAVTDYPGISEEILETAGIDISGNNGEGIAVLSTTLSEPPTLSDHFQPVGNIEIPEDELEEDEPVIQYAVFGRKNILHMNANDIDYGQTQRRLNLPDGDDDSGLLSL